MMRSWIHFTRGRFVRQARVGLGELREEHLSRHGFAGPVAMIYRESGPNEVVRVQGDYRRREIDSADVVSSDATDARGAWQVLLSNDDVAVAISRRREAMPYRFRNLDGDLLYFVHRGTGVLATEFGPIRYAPGDYVMLPKSTTYRHMPDAGDSLLLVVESPLPISLTEHEQVGRHTPIDPTMLDVPDVVDYGWPEESEYEVRIKAGSGHTSIFYKNDPLKTVGWKGDLFPPTSSTSRASCRSCRTASTSRRRPGRRSRRKGLSWSALCRRSRSPTSTPRNCRATTATSTWTR